ncbi:MbcA/ParS/Xre antitoxin family protein [Arenimonas sp.]|uniref:MbcA/ParS/Xre antitoxin family protein n=1 Tax=Arenimonas sp. TaxID=1872635 RepID=UPI0035AE573D
MTSSRVTSLDTKRVLAAADLVTGDRKESVAWLKSPVGAFGGQSPEALITLGRTNDVIRYLESLSNGYIG